MTKPSPFRYFKTSPEVIRLAVMLYIRFPLSLRNVEDLLHERGIDVSHETIRFWWSRFSQQPEGIQPTFAADEQEGGPAIRAVALCHRDRLFEADGADTPQQNAAASAPSSNQPAANPGAPGRPSWAQ